MNLSKHEIIVDNKLIKNQREIDYKKNIWRLCDIGIKPPPYTRASYISFEKINPEWLRQLAKKFIHFQSSTKAFYTIQQYLRSIGHFSKFLKKYGHCVQSEEINRSLMLDFIEYVCGLKTVNEAKNKLITHIKLLITLAAVEGWESVTKEKIMFRQDRLPVKRARPRYIPHDVLDQLKQHINGLSPDIRRLVIILQHTGRRIGEICALPLDCILKDAEGDFFLRYYEFKMKKEETIPISHEIAALIFEQLEYTLNKYDTFDVKYLFTAKDLGAIQCFIVSDALNRLAVKHLIKGPGGKIWHFQLHQFRHTVGTQMINSGVPAHIVQRYLKHTSSEMTMSYAHLHDSTMKAEFAKFQGKLVDITGHIVADEQAIDIPADLKWLKRNVLAQALPNGYCGLPIQQGGCPHANACLSCSHFRTTGQFLNQHKQQLNETIRILDTAEQNGWSRQIEMNQKVKESLEAIITTLDNK